MVRCFHSLIFKEFLVEIYKFVLIPNFGNIAQITVHSTYENVVDIVTAGCLVCIKNFMAYNFYKNGSVR